MQKIPYMTAIKSKLFTMKISPDFYDMLSKHAIKKQMSKAALIEYLVRLDIEFEKRNVRNSKP